MNNLFNYKRLGHLLRNHVITYAKNFLVGSAIVIAVPVIMAVFNMILGKDSLNFDAQTYFFFVLIIWSFIAAGTSLSEAHNKHQNASFFLLPASILEKIVSRILLMSIALPLFIMILITTASFLESMIDLLRFGEPLRIFTPLDIQSLLKTLWNIIVLQSIFFLGSAWFRRWHVLKTLLFLGVFLLFIGLLSFTIFSLFVRSQNGLHSHETYLKLFVASYANHNFDQFFTAEHGLIRIITTTSQVIFSALIAPFCWVASYLRIKDTEVSDGI